MSDLIALLRAVIRDELRSLQLGDVVPDFEPYIRIVPQPGATVKS